jgi:hypothetical protein
LVVGCAACRANPCDGYTLHAALEQVKNLTKRQLKEVFVRGPGLSRCRHHRNQGVSSQTQAWYYCTAEAGHSATQRYLTGDRAYEE